jgi:hypothetical protein
VSRGALDGVLHRRSKGTGAAAPDFYGSGVGGLGGYVGSAPVGARAVGLLRLLGAGAAAPNLGVLVQHGRVAALRERRWIRHPRWRI